TREARPPRQIDDRIPRELERICLKALAKRACDRYSTACDMADDLRVFLREQPQHETTTAEPPELGHAPALPSTKVGTAESSLPPIRIVPKGLRSFDEGDADYFLELLPGPRDREGLPDVVRFWKKAIESTDPEASFHVGLIYGPSGCGKSSLVRAGLLPRLSQHVHTVYIEVTADETEARLLRSLRRAGPPSPAGAEHVPTPGSLPPGRGPPPPPPTLTSV